jgi:hypothetical protein
MKFRFNADEWQRLTPAERVSRCRILAQEAETLAGSATTHLKTLYLELAIQLKMLAGEMVLQVAKCDMPVSSEPQNSGGAVAILALLPHDHAVL